ncbi:MAG: GC-type dockerin domain-anchored protein [Planctomycetota bacterium]
MSVPTQGEARGFLDPLAPINPVLGVGPEREDAESSILTKNELFVDFDAPTDGDGTEASPWNTLIGKRIAGGDDVTLWLEGEANHVLDLPHPIVGGAGSGVDTLRIKSRHLVDETAAPAHVTRGLRVSKLEVAELGEGIYFVQYPVQTGVILGVTRGFEVPSHTPIPPEGLREGLAFDLEYVETFRVRGSTNVALRRAASLEDLEGMTSGYVPFTGSLYVKTPTGDAPGTGTEPEYRVITQPDENELMQINSFGPDTFEMVEVAGLTFSLNVKGSRQRTLAINPAFNVVVRDNLFVACNDDDNIALVNGGGPGQTLISQRNQHIGVGRDGGPFVASNQPSSTERYEYAVVEDQVVHSGWRLNHLDGSDADLAWSPLFNVAAFHGRKVVRADVRRCIALSYNLDEAMPWQLPADASQIPEDPFDADAYPYQVADIYVESARRLLAANSLGVHATRVYLGPTLDEQSAYFNELPAALFSSCVFDVNVLHHALGATHVYDTAFVNCTIRARGHSAMSIIGVGFNSGRVFLRENTFERIGGQGMRFASAMLGYGAPAARSDAILGPGGTTDLGIQWFGEGTLEVDPLGTQSPVAPLGGVSLDEFKATYGQGLRFGPTGAEKLPLWAPVSDVASAYQGDLAGPLSEFVDGPAGVNLNAFSGRIGAFQTGHPDACSMADIAFPYGVLDLSDVDAFIASFLSGGADADLAAPAGIIDLTDVDRFIATFLPGCSEDW